MIELIRATYEFEPVESAPELAIQVSVGMAGAGGPLAARVVETSTTVDGVPTVTLEVPLDQGGFDPALVMAALVVGEAMELGAWTRCRLVDLGLPQEVAPGPAHGHDGRNLLGVIVKPSLGLDPSAVAEVVAAAVGAGAGLVKDDELAADLTWCPLQERVRAVAKVLGTDALYLANVGGSPEGLIGRARAAVDLGATGVLVRPLVDGLAALVSLRRADLGVHILAHRVGFGPLVRNPRFGATGAVMTGLYRSCGADMVAVGAYGAKLYETDAEVDANLAAARAASGSIKPAWALMGGGLGPSGPARQFDRAGGTGLVGLLGSSAYRHPDGIAGAVRQAAAHRRPSPASSTPASKTPASKAPPAPAVAAWDDPIPPTIEWRGDHVRLIDQRLLPAELTFYEARTVAELAEAIATLAVRGAPALGVAGAMGVALAHVTGEDLGHAAARLRATRPTAVNLGWGIDRALAAADPVVEACALAESDVADNRRLGAHGAGLLAPGSRVYTHCNAGALACVGYGTALGVVRAAAAQGRVSHAWVGETRPLLQGSRLTAWELDRLGIPATVVADVMAGSLMASGDVDAVVVGADRIAANGDVANKVGTYPLAVLARRHGVALIVAAPTATIDRDCPDGDHIPIEQRSGAEVVVLGGRRLAPAGVEGANRAFDVTPAELISAIVTEVGVLSHPLGPAIARLGPAGLAKRSGRGYSPTRSCST